MLKAEEIIRELEYTMSDMNRKIVLPLSIAAGLGLGVGGFETYYAPRALPGVSAAGVAVGGLTQTESVAKLQAFFKSQTPPIITVQAGEKSLSVSAPELGWQPDAETTAKAALMVGRDGGVFENIAKRFSNVNVPLIAAVDAEQFKSRLTQIAQPFELGAKNAAIVVAQGKYVVRADTIGRSLDFSRAIEAFKTKPNLTKLELDVIDVPATLKKAELEPIAAKANLLLRPVVLQYTPPGTDKNLSKTLNNEEVRNLFFVQKTGLSADQKAIQSALENVASSFDREPVNARYKTVGGAFVKTKDQLGFQLDSKTALALVAGEILNPETTQIVLPVIVSKPSISAASLPDPKTFSLISSATTTFYGSPNARIKNVYTAIGHLNGYVVPTDGVFNFNDAVGNIGIENGFAEGLIISQGRTVKGVGGGVCQASTTAFRALYKAGLPIIERNQHAYRVHYYDPIIGMDAAVYQPSLNLRMKNDTGGPILVRASARGLSATVQLYGVSSKRKVVISNPRILWRVPAPASKTEIDYSLRPGQRKQVDWSADGYGVRVNRTVIDAGATRNDVLSTNYRAWQAVYAVGPTPRPVTRAVNTNPRATVRSGNRARAATSRASTTRVTKTVPAVQASNAPAAVVVAAPVTVPTPPTPETP
jgi:vancomycin resistance protein YoaR